MQMLAAVAAALVVAWVVLVVVAQVLNPDQSPLAMGMSGLARGRAPWVMKSSFIVRGLSALVLVAALPSDFRVAGVVFAGIALFWVWGVGSAALALADTDMPGEAPTPAGKAHALIAMVAYTAGVAGAIILSYSILRDGLSGAILALPVSITAAAALAVQFVAFGAAAREARAGAPAGRAVGAAPSAALPGAALEAASPAVSLPLVSDVPPQLGADMGTAAVAPARPRSAGAGAGTLHDFASFAGLYQRIFVGLLMAWTLLVALGLLSS